MSQSAKGYSASYQQRFDVLPHFGSATVQPKREVILSSSSKRNRGSGEVIWCCLLYTSDAADETSTV